jgi:membrane protease YdiL (CAAX protease family)
MEQSSLAGPGRAVSVRPPFGWAMGARGRQIAVALATLAAFGVAEGVSVFGEPVTGIALHAVVLTALLVASGIGRRANEDATSRLLYSLALVPLIRIVSLAMPLSRFEEAYWFAAAGAPIFVAAAVVMGGLGLRPREVGFTLSRRALRWQLAVVPLGFVLGFCEYAILRPEPLIGELTPAAFLPPALVLLLFTGVLEEFVFRGVLQRTAGEALGRLDVLYVSLIFAILHLGYRSVTDFFFVFVIALLYGWVVRRTGSIMGVSVSHGITNITLFLLMPFVPVLSGQPEWLSALV